MTRHVDEQANRQTRARRMTLVVAFLLTFAAGAGAGVIGSQAVEEGQAAGAAADAESLPSLATLTGHSNEPTSLFPRSRGGSKQQTADARKAITAVSYTVADDDLTDLGVEGVTPNAATVVAAADSRSLTLKLADDVESIELGADAPQNVSLSAVEESTADGKTATLTLGADPSDTVTTYALDGTDGIKDIPMTVTFAAPSPSPSPTESESASPEPSDTESASQAPEPSDTESGSETPEPSDTASASQSPEPSDTESASESPSPSGTATASPSPTPTETSEPVTISVTLEGQADKHDTSLLDGLPGTIVLDPSPSVQLSFRFAGEPEEFIADGSIDSYVSDPQTLVIQGDDSFPSRLAIVKNKAAAANAKAEADKKAADQKKADEAAAAGQTAPAVEEFTPKTYAYLYIDATPLCTYQADWKPGITLRSDNTITCDIAALKMGGGDYHSVNTTGDGKSTDDGEAAKTLGIEHFYAQFGNDVAAPTVDTATRAADRQDVGRTTVTARKGEFTIAASDDFSGVESISVDGITLGEGNTLTQDGQDDDGAYTATLAIATPGVYDLSRITITATDNAKNTSTTTTLADVLSGGEKKLIVLPENATPLTWSLTNGTDALSGRQAGQGLTYYREPSIAAHITASGGIDGEEFAGILESISQELDGTDDESGLMSVERTASGTTTSRECGMDAFDAESDGRRTCDTGISADGVYTVTLAAGLPDPVTALFSNPSDSASFGIDATAPQVSVGGSLIEGFDKNHVVSRTVGDTSFRIYSAAGEQTVTLSVHDYLSVGESNRPTQMNEENTSGIDTASASAIAISIPAPVDLDGNAMEGGQELHLNCTGGLTCDAEKGTVAFTLSTEGLYDLSRSTVIATDRAGNAHTYHLGDFTGNRYNALVIDMQAPTADNVSMTVANKDGVPASNNGLDTTHRGDVDITVSITDRWFPLYQQIHDDGTDAPFLTGSVDTAPDAFFDMLPLTQGWSSADGVTWTYAGYQLPRAAGSDRPLEGRYTLTMRYAGLADPTNASGTAEKSETFAIDYTGPALGGLSISAPGSGYHGWNVQGGEYTITIGGVADAISDVDAVSLWFDGSGFDARGGSEPVVGFADGAITIRVSGDGQRLDLTRTSITIADRAGNTTGTGILSSYQPADAGQGNALFGATGVVIDASTPVLSVSYDNNDARNGSYYNASRTMTLALDDAALTLVREFEPDTVVAVVSVDGARTEYAARDFASTDGSRWTVSQTLTTNGDWSVAASFTDIAGRAAQPVSDSFTIDTLAPALITWSFDDGNTNSSQAKDDAYYNAARTFHATVRERNLNAAASPVEVTRTTDAGASTVTPYTSWRDGGAQRSDLLLSTQAVTLSADGHYTIHVTATDLAGNTASQTIDVPEFVIDVTRPSITISGVESHKAYPRGEAVTPRITWSDDNIDKSSITYSIEGTYHEKTTTSAPQAGGDDALKGEADRTAFNNTDPNGLTISWGDFHDTTDVDDVYVLTASAMDLAGNTAATASVKFSVNRYGSTFEINDDAEEAVKAGYVQKAPSVVITETNVSGIDTSQSTVTVARGNQIDVQDVTPEAEGSEDTDSAAEGTAADTPDAWSRTVYRVPATALADEGSYHVYVESHDAAGHTGDNRDEGTDGTERTPGKRVDISEVGAVDIAFTVDRTAPVASVIGAQDGQTYRLYELEGNTLHVALSAEDNIALDTASISVDGGAPLTWDSNDDPAAIHSDDDPSTSLDLGGGNHTITVKAADFAGNATEHTISVYVASNWLLYTVHQNAFPFFAVIALVVIAVVVAVIVLVTRARRRRYA